MNNNYFFKFSIETRYIFHNIFIFGKNDKNVAMLRSCQTMSWLVVWNFVYPALFVFAVFTAVIYYRHGSPADSRSAKACWKIVNLEWQRFGNANADIQHQKGNYRRWWIGCCPSPYYVTHVNNLCKFFKRNLVFHRHVEMQIQNQHFCQTKH